MLESARIARGAVKPLTELTPGDNDDLLIMIIMTHITPDNADAVVFPGGFGAAKNLSDFGFKVD